MGIVPNIRCVSALDSEIHDRTSYRGLEVIMKLTKTQAFRTAPELGLVVGLMTTCRTLIGTLRPASRTDDSPDLLVTNMGDSFMASAVTADGEAFLKLVPFKGEIWLVKDGEVGP
jgi:hypothetical protein